MACGFTQTIDSLVFTLWNGAMLHSNLIQLLVFTTATSVSSHTQQSNKMDSIQQLCSVFVDLILSTFKNYWLNNYNYTFISTIRPRSDTYQKWDELFTQTCTNYCIYCLKIVIISTRGVGSTKQLTFSYPPTISPYHIFFYHIYTRLKSTKIHDFWSTKQNISVTSVEMK